MTSSKKLQRLAQMQTLHERKTAGSVGKAAKDVVAKTERAKELSQQRLAAHAHLEETMQASTFCPDRMIMAAGHLSIADDAHDTGQAELSRAQAHESSMRDAWQVARFKTDDINSQARRAGRHEERRRDDAKLAESLSLRAAMKGSTKA